MKCMNKDCKKEAKTGLSGLCQQHWEEMLEEQKESAPEVCSENTSW